MGQAQSTAKARVSQRDATALYDNLSGVYNLFGHLAESNARDRSLELAEVKPGQHVLEVAVGTGLALVHVVRANPAGRNVGIDISWSAKISYGFQSLWIKTLGATSLPVPGLEPSPIARESLWSRQLEKPSSPHREIGGER